MGRLDGFGVSSGTVDRRNRGGPSLRGVTSLLEDKDYILPLETVTRTLFPTTPDYVVRI